MPALLIRYRVRDYELWQRAFSDEAEIRRAHGAHREHQFRNSTDPSEIWLLIEWDDPFRAQLFVKSDDLRAALDRAGVIDQPDYWYLEEITEFDR